MLKFYFENGDSMEKICINTLYFDVVSTNITKINSITRLENKYSNSEGIYTVIEIKNDISYFISFFNFFTGLNMKTFFENILEITHSIQNVIFQTITEFFSLLMLNIVYSSYKINYFVLYSTNTEDLL